MVCLVMKSNAYWVWGIRANAKMNNHVVVVLAVGVVMMDFPYLVGFVGG